jgi:undecaprenyl-diphosphatase
VIGHLLAEIGELALIAACLYLALGSLARREQASWFTPLVPAAWSGLFEAITLTGSYKVMLPLTIAATIALLYLRHRSEALILLVSVIGGAGVVYVLKSVVARDRPTLWSADWYWGSSFPSGHTLAVAAFATAVVVCVRRLWPEQRRISAWVAVVWIALVGLSRLVLGVHWPSDVLAAACIGTCLPLIVSVGLELRRT